MYYTKHDTTGINAFTKKHGRKGFAGLELRVFQVSWILGPNCEESRTVDKNTLKAFQPQNLPPSKIVHHPKMLIHQLAFLSLIFVRSEFPQKSFRNMVFL